MNYLVALHVISVVCWFAGLFYLPRLFVYHALNRHAEVRAQLAVMAYKLYWYIMMPAMALSLLTGLVLLTLYIFKAPGPMGWVWLKLFLVLLLVIFHFFCGYCVTMLQTGNNLYSERFYRWLNEVPTVLLIFIVILAVVQPF